MSHTSLCCYDNTSLSIYRHIAECVSPCYEIFPFEVLVSKVNPLLVFGRKSQLFFFFLVKVKGQAELLGSGEEGWTREAMADRCLQRPDCTSVIMRRG